MTPFAREIEARADEFKPQELSNAMWAFARLQIPDERFFDLLGDMCVRKMELFNAQNLTNVCLPCLNQTVAVRHRRDASSMASLLESVITAVVTEK